jgi:hypothetical protein
MRTKVEWKLMKKANELSPPALVTTALSRARKRVRPESKRSNGDRPNAVQPVHNGFNRLGSHTGRRSNEIN